MAGTPGRSRLSVASSSRVHSGDRVGGAVYARELRDRGRNLEGLLADEGVHALEPAAWKRLLGKLVMVQVDYLLAQARAGAQALQVFDSLGWLALGREDYLRYVAPHNRELFASIARAGVPVINLAR